MLADIDFGFAMALVATGWLGLSRLLARLSTPAPTPPSIEKQQHSWEGSAIATRSGVMNMREAMRFTLSHPVSTVIIGCDNIAQLEENVQIAREFTPLSQTQMATLNDLAAPVAKQSLFFRFTDRTKG